MAISPAPIRLPHYKAMRTLIRELRLAKDMSQQDLAEKADLDTVYISYLENGRRQPSVEALFNIFTALDTNLATVFKVIEWCSPKAVPDGVSISTLKKLLLSEPQRKRARVAVHKKENKKKRSS